jgi:hypothetical protein
MTIVLVAGGRQVLHLTNSLGGVWPNALNDRTNDGYVAIRRINRKPLSPTIPNLLKQTWARVTKLGTGY